MFLRSDFGLDQAGGTVAAPFGRAMVAAPPRPGRALDRLHDSLVGIDWTPDLGAAIGSATWWRGLATLGAVLASTWVLAPRFDQPVLAAAPAPAAGEAWQETRTQSIAPLAWGAGSGRRLGASDLVRPLAETPERPILELGATVGSGGGFAATLQRAGVSRRDALRAGQLVADAVPVDTIRPGTHLQITLGRRASRRVARPLERIAFRARFDLNLVVARAGSDLTLDRQPIAIDHSPLRLQGLAGTSLYRSVRASGAPAAAVADYLRALAGRVAISRVAKADRFDLIIERARAATGETQLGALQYAGLAQARGGVRLLRWESEGRDRWFGPSGRIEERGTLNMPVAGRISSDFGRRRHPLLHIVRMHEGLDIAAPYGTPVRAATGGIVAFAGRKGGYGNFIRLTADSLATGYGHLSRIAVRGGQRVMQGQVIGYVGSTGLSTGPHLHWEVWRGGAAVDPRRIAMDRVIALTGGELRTFRARFDTLLATQPGN